jgi:hypothetical protein
MLFSLRFKEKEKEHVSFVHFTTSSSWNFSIVAALT